MSVILRVARPEDAEACGAICFEAFRSVAERHNFPPDFPSAEMPTGLFKHVISLNDVYVVVAEVEGRIVGSNVLWENGEIAGVGPITVDPLQQSSSVGRLLMENVLTRLKDRDQKAVRLVQASFNNLSLALYSKLGFDVKEPLSVMFGVPFKKVIDGFNVRVATIDDLKACDALCKKVHGHTRHKDVAGAIQQGTANVVERDGKITGYTTGIGFFGHAVAEATDDLKALIGAADQYAGPGFHIPSRNAELMRWCLENGLRIRQQMTLMSIGPYKEPMGVFMPSVIF